MQSECASQSESQHESERGEDMDDDDGAASVMSGSVLHGARSVNSSSSLKKRKSRSGIDFLAWSFQMIFKANFAPDRRRKEDIPPRTLQSPYNK